MGFLGQTNPKITSEIRKKFMNNKTFRSMDSIYGKIYKYRIIKINKNK